MAVHRRVQPKQDPWRKASHDKPWHVAPLFWGRVFFVLRMGAAEERCPTKGFQLEIRSLLECSSSCEL